MAEVGRFEYLSVTADNDMRLKEYGAPAKQWTEEEIWQFITLDGAAVDPRRVKGLVRVRLHIAHVPDVQGSSRGSWLKVRQKLGSAREHCTLTHS